MDIGTVTNEAGEKGLQIEKNVKSKQERHHYSANKCPRKMIWKFSIQSRS